MKTTFKLEGQRISRKKLNEIVGKDEVDTLAVMVLTEIKKEQTKNDIEDSRLIRYRQQKKIGTHTVQMDVQID